MENQRLADGEYLLRIGDETFKVSKMKTSSQRRSVLCGYEARWPVCDDW